ncbi:MAG: curved DNA-binding protein [Gammaproteobacteria bacterium]|nr:MAG: curved DNA-binding protein [Gammaproteobacteria bacterium]
MAKKDYYEILGVPRDASQEDIKRAYRRLARKYHPDVSKEPDAEARFKEIGEAYEVLKDPEKRAAYDRFGQAGAEDFQAPPGWGGGFRTGADFSELFEEIFGGFAGRERGRTAGARSGFAWRGADHYARLDIDLEDAYRGGNKLVTIRVPVLRDGRPTTETRTLQVNIPRGILEGQQIRLAGQGAPGVGGGPPGDLYLEVAFKPHPLYTVQGRDVHLKLPVAPWEAALGAKVRVPTPDGPVELTIPPNSASGRKLRLRGKGIPARPPGDLYVELQVVLPPADDPRARTFYERMARELNFNPRAALGV